MANLSMKDVSFVVVLCPAVLSWWFHLSSGVSIVGRWKENNSGNWGLQALREASTAVACLV